MIGEEIWSEKMTVPRDFLRAYLKAKGWRTAAWFHCWTCDERVRLEIEHPVKWLWEHASKGHECGMNLCHAWKRAVGPPSWGLNPEFEYWYRWWWATWNPETKQFDLEVEFTDCDGYEV